jgi:hypothetical protein
MPDFGRNLATSDDALRLGLFEAVGDPTVWTRVGARMPLWVHIHVSRPVDFIR